MPFHLESDLLEPVSTWLQAAGFDVFDEVPILRHRADLVGLRGDGVTAIEMKLRKWDEALRQAIAYQLAADWAWVAMPLCSAFKAYHQRWRFEAERVGLLAIDERGEYALQSQRDLLRGSSPSCRNDSFSGGATAVETSYTTFPLK